MEKTKQVCEICSSYLYKCDIDGIHYCPECDSDVFKEYEAENAKPKYHDFQSTVYDDSH